ncbi:hypothetical protein K435DRAFT_32444 [Dendrothele bispora CBS 962.96]|uniref:Uncharacterized protein n=1 Tax=Dendrothele bispora (strain CBS 962.96) TaxID=1314807 RepID=A0A4S8M8W1_DENBC|nr:hypothetical protein K435DRAFT_32444 [Dendrothele bispora CBS 962.96]
MSGRSGLGKASSPSRCHAFLILPPRPNQPLTPLLNVLQKHITSNSSTSHRPKIQFFRSLLARPSFWRPIRPATYSAVLTVSFDVEARRRNVLGKDDGKGCYQSGRCSRVKIVIQKMEEERDGLLRQTSGGGSEVKGEVETGTRREAEQGFCLKKTFALGERR